MSLSQRLHYRRCLWDKLTKSGLSVLNSWGSGWLGAPSNIRALKGSPSLARYFLISETQHQWNKSRKRILPVQASCSTTSVWQVEVIFSLQGSGAGSFIEEAVLITHPAASAQNSRVRLPLPAFKPGACSSSLPINVFCGSAPRHPRTGHFCLY